MKETAQQRLMRIRKENLEPVLNFARQSGKTSYVHYAEDLLWLIENAESNQRVNRMKESLERIRLIENYDGMDRFYYQENLGVAKNIAEKELFNYKRGRY